MNRPPRALLLAALVFQALLSAGTYLAAASAMHSIGPIALTFLRNVVSAVIYAALLPLMLARGKRLPPKSLWARVIWLSVLAVPMNMGFFLFGIHRSTPSHAALLYSLAPLFVMLAARGSLGERLVPSRVIGVLIALGGTLWLLSQRGVDAPEARFGDLFILIGVIGWSLFSVHGKPLVHEVGPLAATAWPIVFGTVLFLPIGLFGAETTDWMALSKAAWFGVFYLGVITSVVSYLCWYWALRYLDAGQVAIFTNLQPVATAALSWLVLGERMSPSFAASAALVLFGVALVQRA